MSNYASNEETVEKLLDFVNGRYQTYKSDREQFEDIVELCDYMHKCAQNRTINSSEKEKGANLPDDERANVGSTMFHRISNQNAATGMAIQTSKDMPFKYSPVYNEAIRSSTCFSLRSNTLFCTSDNIL